MEMKRVYTLVVFSLLYLTIITSASFTTYRLIPIFGYAVNFSATYCSLLYLSTDAITRFTTRAVAINLVIILHIFCAIFIMLLYSASILPAPFNSPIIAAYNVITEPLPKLLLGELIGSISAGVVEVIVYAALQQKMKHFLLPSFLSTSIIVIAHNIPTQYIAYHKTFSNIMWQLTFAGIITNIIAAFFGALIITAILKKLRIGY